MSVPAPHLTQLPLPINNLPLPLPITMALPFRQIAMVKSSQMPVLYPASLRFPVVLAHLGLAQPPVTNTTLRLLKCFLRNVSLHIHCGKAPTNSHF